jgi:hypothetical protein
MTASLMFPCFNLSYITVFPPGSRLSSTGFTAAADYADQMTAEQFSSPKLWWKYSTANIKCQQHHSLFREQKRAGSVDKRSGMEKSCFR